MKKIFLIIALCNLSVIYSKAQLFDADMFSDDDWDDQHTFVMGKWSQLFYELNVGITRSKSESANFIYLSAGLGKPTTKNAWRKFLPESKQAAPSSKEEMLSKKDDSTSGLYSGTIGVGWQHYFNHWIGLHLQAGWGFIADFGGGNSSSSDSTDDEDTKSTFIYNSVPIQAGVDFCLWNNLMIQVGATYMWKEIPIITVGVGLAF